MEGFEFYLTDSLSKVFATWRPAAAGEMFKINIFQGEVPAVQLVYKKEHGHQTMSLQKHFAYRIEGGVFCARVRDVELVPSTFPCYEVTDDNYLTSEPGLFPDLLRPRRDNVITPIGGQYRSLWIDFLDTGQIPAGEYLIEILIEDLEEKEKIVETLFFRIEVTGERLPVQTLIHTEWFHADCLADYYHVEVFSEKHWEILEHQIMLAGEELGINMLLTPVFTPPLDTDVGGKRTTVQLVDITRQDGRYFFGFERLTRWCAICRRAGIGHIEIPHLFTQWGAKATPNIYGKEAGEEKQFFGWHVAADSEEYRRFLEDFLPALQRELAGLGYDREHVYFHISDEPEQEHLESYRKATERVADLLDGWQIVDALSDYSFYEQGLIKHPIPANNRIQPFVEHGVPDLWVYYCCAQYKEVPNRFFAMPSARNRIMGVLMYLYRIKGFLHWGYNFYNSQYSVEHIDPFLNTHAGYAFPSGDAFLVYPGMDGKPWSSIRAEVQREGIYDYLVLMRLEEMIGRERTVALVMEGEGCEFTFESYPTDPGYFCRLRARVTEEMKRRLQNHVFVV